MILFLILVLCFFYVEQTLNELIYEVLFISYKNDRAARDKIAFIRNIERRIVWALVECLGALTILYLVYNIG